nr:hypothetical protein [uncultured Undibacterium sp.]
MYQVENRRFTNITRWSLLAFACITMSACSTMQNGGAPAPSFSYEEDLKALEDMYQTAAKLSTYKANATAKERNDFVNGRIALYNIRYQRFVRDLGVDKQHLDAGTDGVLIGLNLASAATGAIRAKTNIALAAAGITGGKSTIDKYFYFDKTIPALIATMNSQRKQVLLRILNGVKLDIDQYPFTQALNDLNNYEMAGTLIGAIDAIQLDSSMKNQEADAKLQKLIVPTEAQTQEALSLSDALISLKANTPENLQKINAILSKINGTPANYTDFTAASQAISAAFKPGNDQAWRDALTSVGISVKQ